MAIKQYKHETSTLETLKEELKVMRELTHENLIRLIAVKENAVNKLPKGTVQTCFAIVLEYAAGGELFDFVAETGKFSEKVTRTYFHQMMNGLHYMHDKGFAHRDIKPENLLLTSTFILKIADFGFSCLIRGKDGTGILKTKLGTEGYMAPEIASKSYDGRKTDIFAAGVILFIMYAGNPPFEKPTVTDPYYKLIKEKRYDVFWNAHSRKRLPTFFSESFKDLVQKMFAYVPGERPTIVEIAKHPWAKGAISSHQ